MLIHGRLVPILGILIGILLIHSSSVISSEADDSPPILSLDSLPYFTQHNSDHILLYPRSSCPVFVEQGGSFTITFHTDSVDDIYAILTTSYEPIVDTFWCTIVNITHEEKEWTASVTIPNEIPIELYNLSIIIQNNGYFYELSQPRAVNVIDTYKDTFTFIHVTDFHIGDPRGIFENFRETVGMKSIQKCIEEINLLHPDFVVLTGDMVFGQLYPFEYKREYQQCYDVVQRFDVPTFLIPGNHDEYWRFGEDGQQFWEYYFGPLYYSFDYGTYHFTAVNSYDWNDKFQRFAVLMVPLNWGGTIQHTQLEWIKEDLAHTQSTLHFMLIHHNPLWENTWESLLGNSYKNREQLLALIDQYDVDMVLAGHEHYDNITIVNDTIFVTTATPSSIIMMDDSYWGYRMISITNGSIDSYNYKEPCYSIPTYRLNYMYTSSYSITIKNDLEMPLSVLVKFYIPLQEEYLVENGKIIQIRSNDIASELYVESTINPESEKTVTIIADNIKYIEQDKWFYEIFINKETIFPLR